MELLGMAIQEGIDYHSQDAQAIDKYVLSISRAIDAGAFSFVEGYVKKLTSSAKERVWSQLSNVQKASYRHWQKNYQNMNVTSAPIVVPPITQAEDIKAYKVPDEVPSITETETAKAPVLVLTAPTGQQSNSDKPILKAKQQTIPIEDEKTSLPGRYKVGDIVEYIGDNHVKSQQYTGKLTVHSFAYGKVCVLTPNGRISTWLDYDEISKI
ncbi:hypothetical protein NIES4071_104810 (plasmid) [Calothrix sp. NIES-4071]|nr:hypothetical protein NIES4071_104810 [Calothrix sp. NIES-4071]BAZ64899.1 hypothetical protein NIES4105_106320 [Calothrix sp. NIES-4105]